MEFNVFTATENDNERRIDRVIRKFLPNLTLNSIYKAIRKNLIKVNDKKINENYKISTNDKIKIASFLLEENTENQVHNNISEKKAENFNLQKENASFPFEIILKTSDLLFINKPYDKTVHGFNDSIDVTVKSFYKNDNNSLSFSPGPLHRLDKKTTGLLCFSQSLKGAKWFSQKIETHEIQKKYIALLEGNLIKNEIWTDEISKNEKQDGFYKVNLNQNSKDTKNSVTLVYPIWHGFYKNKSITLCQIEIKTGRTHQIRSQASYHGFPLLGDTAYDGTKIFEKRDFFLHAYSLTLPENQFSLPEKIKAPLDKDFEAFLKKVDCSIDLERL